MRMIDADELKTAFPCGEYIRTESVRATIDHMPTIESEPQWNLYPKRPPKEEDEYLVTVEVFGHIRINIASYSKNLYKVDKYDFADKKGKTGFYNIDSEYGYYEETGVKAWMPMMAPYEGGENE